LRIRKISIKQWRHFENVELNLDDNIGLVCIVGANGTGKSHLLELIAACAHRLGLSPGIDLPRGNPFSDDHDFSLEFYITEGLSLVIDNEFTNDPAFLGWDRTLIIESQHFSNSDNIVYRVGGISDLNASHLCAQRILSAFRASREVNFLSLDANRAYPKKNTNSNDVAHAYDTDWEKVEFTRGKSFASTTTLYDEWIKYFFAQENLTGTLLLKESRRAKQTNSDAPIFIDHFDNYREALRKVLPHLIFTGVDAKKRTILFDTTGLELSFDQLSGGEREIAFLIGQIDRFRLRDGLFLLDEPELHLNSDLIRAWVVYLTSTVRTGQIWLATHSLEAVEAAGQNATFVLERNPETGKVDSLARLDKRPILSALSRAVGTPAFSMSQLAFVFVEGAESIGERDRFRKLTGVQSHIRFIEGGSCNEVLRHVDSVKVLSSEAETEIRIGGIIDRDFRSTEIATRLAHKHHVFLLPVHEVENLFLHPQTIQRLLEQNGNEQLDALEIIREASDKRAGSWIFLKTMAILNEKPLHDLPSVDPNVKHRIKGLSWQKFEENPDAIIQEIVEIVNYQSASHQQILKKHLKVSMGIYARKRTEEIWKDCEGKEILIDLAKVVGFKDECNDGGCLFLMGS
jgi:predicted ATPase